MRTTPFLLLSLCLVGCYGPETVLSDGGCLIKDAATTAPDQASPLKCAAAKGLPGENLICVDFSALADQMLTTPPPSQLGNWDFEQNAKGCWQIMGGKLQIKNFSTFMTSCGFLMQALMPSDYAKYNTFTLSVIQTLDVNETQQKAQIMMGQDDPPTRLVDQATGKQPRQQRIYQIAKAALPNGGNGYQPLFKLTSGVAAGGTAQGWQIESIAVNANP